MGKALGRMEGIHQRGGWNGLCHFAWSTGGREASSWARHDQPVRYESDEGTWVIRPQSGKQATQTWMGIRKVSLEVKKTKQNKTKKLKLKPGALCYSYRFLHPPLGKQLTEMISFHYVKLSTVASAPDKRPTQTGKITVTTWLNWTWWSKSPMAHWLHIFTTYCSTPVMCSACSMPPWKLWNMYRESIDSPLQL